MELRIGTLHGIILLDEQRGKWRITGRTLENEDVVNVAHHPSKPEIIYAGTYGHGLFRSRDRGGSWEKLPLEIEYVRSIEFDGQGADAMYVGTEPANLFRSDDGGDRWVDLEIRRLPEAGEWRLPYSPRSGALRSLLLPPARPGMVYGAVEQGGVLKSSDGGAHWAIMHDHIHPDVHWLAGDPADPDKIYAATGDGLFRTMNGGRDWKLCFDDYTRAVLVHPRNPQMVFAGPAEDVGERGRIVVSRNGGETWELASGGLLTPFPDMVELFVTSELLPETIFAVMSEGGLYFSSLDEIEWKPFEPVVKSVQCLDVVRS